MNKKTNRSQEGTTNDKWNFYGLGDKKIRPETMIVPGRMG